MRMRFNIRFKKFSASYNRLTNKLWVICVMHLFVAGQVAGQETIEVLVCTPSKIITRFSSSDSSEEICPKNQKEKPGCGESTYPVSAFEKNAASYRTEILGPDGARGTISIDRITGSYSIFMPFRGHDSSIGVLWMGSCKRALRESDTARVSS